MSTSQPLGDALERAPQDVESLGKAKQDVANVLASDAVLRHQDKASRGLDRFETPTADRGRR